MSLNQHLFILGTLGLFAALAFLSSRLERQNETSLAELFTAVFLAFFSMVLIMYCVLFFFSIFLSLK